MPLSIEKTTIPVMSPITIPRIVNADRNLCDEILSIAISRTSFGSELDKNIISGYWLLVTGYWLLVNGYWLLVTGYRIQVTCFILTTDH